MNKLPYNEAQISGLVRKVPVNDGEYGVEYDLAIGNYTISELADFIEENFKGEEITITIRRDKSVQL